MLDDAKAGKLRRRSGELRTSNDNARRSAAEKAQLKTWEVKKSHTDRMQIDRAAASATNVAREAAMAFLDADVNNDGQLEFEEVRRPPDALQMPSRYLAVNAWQQ